MSPNHKGLMVSVYNQELTMLSHYLSHILRGEIAVTSYEHTDEGMVVRYEDLDSLESGEWTYPADMNTFIHEQLVRMITAEYSDLDH